MIEVASQFVDDPTRVVNRMNVAAPTQVNLQVRIAEVARNIDRQLGIQWNDLSVGINGGRVGFRGGKAVHGDYRPRYGAIRGSFNDRRGAAGAGGGRARHHHGRAEPDRAVGRAGEVPRRRRVSLLDRQRQRHQRPVQGLRHRAELHADGDRRQPDQPQRSATEVSELDFANNADVPSLSTRRAETTVDLASGQSFAIAGLMQNRSSRTPRGCRPSARCR